MTTEAPTALDRRPAGEVSWSNICDGIVVGKDILELLSTSMYVDPLSIYREYIQNAADSIDESRGRGLLKPPDAGRVEVMIDPAARLVRIRDNGCGVPASEFVRRLTSFGASLKRGRGARGFRGVGRLAGLGYCQELVFRSRTAGSNSITELRWDCRTLRAALRSAEEDGDLQRLVRTVVSIREFKNGDYPPHFFDVELRNVIRHRNDQLLDSRTVGEYLAQVAPLPFSPEFQFADEVEAHLRQHVKLGNLSVEITGTDGRLYRPHRNQLTMAPGRQDDFKSVEFVTIPAVDSGTAAVGWVLHHGYTGALPISSLVKGLRVRVGNIQVGDDRLFEELFAETRFNGWVVGEIHVIDPRVIPNGRRDHFEQNVHYANLLTHLAPLAKDLSRRCRTSSIRRNRWREFVHRLDTVKEKLAIIKQGTLGRAEQIRYLQDAQSGLATAEKLLLANQFSPAEGIVPERAIRGLRRDVETLQGSARSATALSHLSKPERRMYERVFAMLYECAPNKPVAKAIVDRMLARL